MKDRLRKLLRSLVPTGTVLQRTVKSGIWATLTNISGRLLQVLMLIVLARILTPAEFGIMGIALLTLSGTKRFTNIGLNAALIQKEERDVDNYLNTTWLLEVGRGLVILVFVFATAPFIAAFFSEPQATPVIRAIGFIPFIAGLRNPGIVYFEKDLEFHRDFLYNTGGSIAQFLVGVLYVLYSPTVWALVAGSLSRPIFKTLLSYVLHDYRPRPTFDLQAARELISFGKWMTGASIIYWIAREGDDAFVGWFLSATALGFYQYAYRLADMPATEMSQIVSQVTFPAYSQVQGDTAELQNALLQSTRFVAFLAFPMSFGIALVTPSFVPTVLGDQWTPIILSMQVLTVYGLAHAITGNYGEVWKTLDRPDYIVKTSGLRVILVAILIWPATARWGIEGAALVISGVYVFPILPIDIYLTARLTELRSIDLYKEYVYPFVASVMMFGVLWYARASMDVPAAVELLLLIPAGVLIYTATALLLEWQFDWGISKNLQMIYRGILG